MAEKHLSFSMFLYCYIQCLKKVPREKAKEESGEMWCTSRKCDIFLLRGKREGELMRQRGESTLSSLGVPVLLTCRRTKVSSGPLVPSGHLFFILVRDFWILSLPLARFVVDLLELNQFYNFYFIFKKLFYILIYQNDSNIYIYIN